MPLSVLFLADGMSLLKSEINPSKDPILASPEYRRNLAANLLYKVSLSAASVVCSCKLSYWYHFVWSACLDMLGDAGGS